MYKVAWFNLLLIVSTVILPLWLEHRSLQWLNSHSNGTDITHSLVWQVNRCKCPTLVKDICHLGREIISWCRYSFCQVTHPPLVLLWSLPWPEKSHIYSTSMPVSSHSKWHWNQHIVTPTARSNLNQVFELTLKNSTCKMSTENLPQTQTRKITFFCMWFFGKIYWL
jgi:hypothetical protein